MKAPLETTGEKEVASILLWARQCAARVGEWDSGVYQEGVAKGRLQVAEFHLPWPGFYSADYDTREIICAGAENEINFLFRRARERVKEAA